MPIVIPADAGIQMRRDVKQVLWIPAFAGMTAVARCGDDVSNIGRDDSGNIGSI